ncbi:helix-turn-helix transcriptional regulator [Brachymonas denitrificans]|uniref:helix-turn-helix domain-containing protein n=1 Tax=Brachymonas denitrificans TaxID=28220 RepID=UPI002B000C59|nr:helix-turn-helix transcriptional regulator [Brachymonas denitrificans]
MCELASKCWTQHITSFTSQVIKATINVVFQATDMVDTAGERQRLGRRLGQQIAARRKAMDLTQDQLAERLEVDAETISRFERGATVPSLVTLDRLAKILSSSTAELLSASSAAPSDLAIQISQILAELTPEDSEFVVSQIKALCRHFQLQVRK